MSVLKLWRSELGGFLQLASGRWPLGSRRGGWALGWIIIEQLPVGMPNLTTPTSPVFGLLLSLSLVSLITSFYHQT